MAKKRYTKVEEEIIQILDAKDREPAWRRMRHRRWRPRLPRFKFSAPRRLRAASGLTWLIATFGIALAAILVSGYSHFLAVVLAIVCILVFLSPMVLSRRDTGLHRPAQEWRGRDINLPPSQDGFVGKIRYRLWEFRNRDRDDRW
jgi:Flp pilus assembly protein TadB